MQVAFAYLVSLPGGRSPTRQSRGHTQKSDGIATTSLQTGLAMTEEIYSTISSPSLQICSMWPSSSR